MVKLAMIFGLLYMGYKLVTKSKTDRIDREINELLDDEYADYEEID